FSVAAHLNADVLLLDEVFAVGDDSFQRKCIAKIVDFSRNGGTIVFVSHDAAAVERLCESAILLREGRVAFAGDVDEALNAYHRLLADERDPAERAAGLSEWGSGEARIADVRVTGPGGNVREAFPSGEPSSLTLQLAATRLVPPPRLSYELRDQADRLLAGGSVETDEIGWPDGAGELSARLDVDALPLAQGRFHFSFALADARTSHLYHRLERVAPLGLHPPRADRRAALLQRRRPAGAVP